MNPWTYLLRRLKPTTSLFCKELRQNRWSYLLPGFAYLPLLVWLSLTQKTWPITLSPQVSVILVVLAAIFAIVYGLQAFAGEADRKTLDFLLTRPMPALTVILVKYMTNLAAFVFWLLCFSKIFRLDFSRLLVIGGASPEWILLMLMSLLTMGVLSGLTKKSAERLVITVGLTIIVTGICYAVWDQIFRLIGASFYWFDVPPHIMGFIQRGLPTILAILSLLIPMTITLWMLKGRSNPLRYRPFHRLLILWFILFFGAWTVRATFGPSIWPTSIPIEEGDWHISSGVALSGSSFPDKKVSQLFIGKLGGNARPVYKGKDVNSPRWSPDGQAIAFEDDQTLKVYQDKRVQAIAQGARPCWSPDGRFIYYLKTPLKREQSIVMKYDRVLGQSSVLGRYDGHILTMTADAHGILYVLQNDGLLKELDFENETTRAISIPKPIALSMQNPSLRTTADQRLLLGVTYDHKVRIYLVDWERFEAIVLEERSGKEISPNAQTIISPDGSGYLWPRIDSAYDFRGFIPAHDEHEHEHEHGDEPKDE